MSNKPDSSEDWCVHYCGLGGYKKDTGWQEAECEAGVRYHDVRHDRAGATNNLDRMPCFKRNKLPCPKQRFRTPEEVAAHRKEITDSLTAWVRDLEKGICPHCKSTVEREDQVGRCVYARPCGHRLYQGRAKGVTEEQYESGMLF